MQTCQKSSAAKFLKMGKNEFECMLKKTEKVENTEFW